MIRAVIFDIDGTLLDWETCLARALRQVLPSLPAEHRHGLPERLRRAIDDWALVVRDSIVVDRRFWMLYLDPLPPWRAALPHAEAAVVAAAAERFRSLLEPVPYPDARPSLQGLRERYSLGVLSNSPHAERTLSTLGLRELFGAVVAADEPERKPHPRAFAQAYEAVGVQPGEAAYVGDSISHDVEGALSAGLLPIWIDRYDERYPLPPGARRIVSLAELPGLLERLI